MSAIRTWTYGLTDETTAQGGVERRNHRQWSYRRISLLPESLRRESAKGSNGVRCAEVSKRLVVEVRNLNRPLVRLEMS